MRSHSASGGPRRRPCGDGDRRRPTGRPDRGRRRPRGPRAARRRGSRGSDLRDRRVRSERRIATSRGIGPGHPAASRSCSISGTLGGYGSMSRGRSGDRRERGGPDPLSWPCSRCCTRRRRRPLGPLDRASPARRSMPRTHRHRRSRPRRGVLPPDRPRHRARRSRGSVSGGRQRPAAARRHGVQRRARHLLSGRVRRPDRGHRRVRG